MTETVSNEYRIYGPPGCGKTTSLARQVRRAVVAHGSAAVLVASFTRAAAAEIAGRDLPIDRDQVGTLHAHGYRTLGRPQLVHVAIEDWNSSYPQYRIKPIRATDPDDPYADDFSHGEDKQPGDELFEHYDLLRAQMRAREMWPTSVQAFASKWEAWKRANSLVDFTDMIELPLRESAVAPGNPSVIFLDECQDMSRLEWSLARRWAAQCEYIVCVGDEDQTIYSWRGASVESFLKPELDGEHKRVLDQSYRVPAAVKRLAEEWISQVRRREPKAYKPRRELLECRADGTNVYGDEVEGEVRRIDATWKTPEEVLSDVEPYLSAGKTVGVLASCSFHLRPLIKVLRAEGVPFHNPWRRKRGDWNPLQVSRGTSTAARLLAYLRPDEEVWGEFAADVWTAEDLRSWIQVVRSEVLRRGSKTWLKSADDYELTIGRLRDLFAPGAFEQAAVCDLDWFAEHLLASKVQAFEYPLEIARRQGARVLREEPRMIVSTIHACKGGEVDVCVVYPDLSPSGYEEWNSSEGEDAIRRLFYVAMTRARETLVLCEGANRFSVEI